MRIAALERVGLSPRLLEPGHLAAFALASTSILSLLAYFSGITSMSSAVRLLLLPAIVLLTVLTIGAARRGRRQLVRRVCVGLWAGSFATLVYDVVRVPLAHAGVPVFKAISYFGTVLLGVPHPTLASEIAGWSYHFSNGVGFAIMYMLLVRRPGPVSAVVWGVTLEAAMLVTPYAEVFGYPKTPTFFAVTIGSHVVYGLGLWLSARYLWNRTQTASGETPARRPRVAALGAAWLLGPLCLAWIGADFHGLHSRTIPVSPPVYIGPHLYVTWNVPEPDRIGVVWAMTRFVDPKARFHFIEPMSKADFGTPFDMPEAEIRRSHNHSAFETLLQRAGREKDPAMRELIHLCHVTEIRPWSLAGDVEARRLAEQLSERLGTCDRLSHCLEAGLAWFDETYESSSR